jgi:hypothetical protein
MKEGWIKLHRTIKRHWITSNPLYFRAWVLTLLEARFVDGKEFVYGKFVDVERGSFVTGRKKYGELVGMSEQQVRSFWRLLEDDQMITKGTTRGITKITIINYDSYQVDQPGDNQSNPENQPDDNHCNKKDKKEKKDIKEKMVNVPFEKFWDLYDKKKGDKMACKKKWNNLKDDERTKIIETLPLFKAGISEKKYQPLPATYLNQRRWEDDLSEEGSGSSTVNRYRKINEQEERR